MARLAVMIGLAVAFAAPALGGSSLPPLPRQGLVVSDARGVSLVDLQGRRLARLTGYRFEPDYIAASGLPRLRDARGRYWKLDPASGRLVLAGDGMPLAAGATLSFANRTWTVRRGSDVLMRMRVGVEHPFLAEGRDVVSTAKRAFDLRQNRALELPRGCELASRRAGRVVLLCGRTAHGSVMPTTIELLIRGERRRIVGPPVQAVRGRHVAGHWRYVRMAPDGRTLLAQWSGECESPAAYVVDVARRKMSPAGVGHAHESSAIGWTRDGRPIVYFSAGICGSGHPSGPGVYILERKGPRRVVAVSSIRSSVAFWGG